jgi:hypothetical protein
MAWPPFDVAHPERMAAYWHAREREPGFMLALYHHHDQTAAWGVRAWAGLEPEHKPSPCALAFEREDHARAWIEQHFPNLALICPHPDDDPRICGIWI